MPNVILNHSFFIHYLEIGTGTEQFLKKKFLPHPTTTWFIFWITYMDFLMTSSIRSCTPLYLRLSVLFSALMLFGVSHGIAQDITFIETDGLLVMEVESMAPVDDWSLRDIVSGYTGTGYYEWKHGNNAQSIDASGSGVLTYAFTISKTGRYRFRFRSAAPDVTEHNDVWVRFRNHEVVAIRNSSEFTINQNAWFKVYQNNSNDNWSWNASTKDNDPHSIFIDVDTPGTYQLQLSGRSTLFKMDRLVLYHADVNQSVATDPNTPESAREGDPVYRDPDTPSTTAPGIQFTYHVGAFSEVPDFTALPINNFGVLNNFDITALGATTNYAFQFIGYINAPAEGEYTFFTTSDDGSVLSIGDQLVVDNDGVHPPVQAEGTIGLKAGLHAIRVGYFQQTGGNSLSVSWTGPGFSTEVIPAGALLHNPENPLPVEMTAFDGYYVDGAIQLHWETASETNNAGFEVQRAIGQAVYETIGYVPGTGTTTEVQQYQYRDKAIPANASRLMYRLKQIDFDGTQTMSPIVYVSIPVEATTLSPNYPDPFNPETVIPFQLSNDSHVSLIIYDMQGRAMQTLVDEVRQSGHHEARFIAPDHLTSGLYMYQLITSQGTQSGIMTLVK